VCKTRLVPWLSYWSWQSVKSDLPPFKLMSWRQTFYSLWKRNSLTSFFFFFLVVPGFKLRAWCLLSRSSTLWHPQLLFSVVIFQVGSAVTAQGWRQTAVILHHFPSSWYHRQGLSYLACSWDRVLLTFAQNDLELQSSHLHLPHN
jgi:hypothetical protein